MRFEDLLKSAPIAAYITEAESRKEAPLGLQFFPNDKTVGLTLEWLKQKLGVNVILNVSNLDAQPRIRTRNGFSVESAEMAFFRESMLVRERDMLNVAVAENQNNPYIRQAFRNAFDDAETLIDAANLATELMRMSLLATNDGDVKISLGTVDNTVYTYNYDSDGSWKSTNYAELTGTDTWDNATNATPLDDLNAGKKAVRSKGYIPRYALMNSDTFADLFNNAQVKAALVNINGNAVNYVDEGMVKNVIQRTTGLIPLIYDKTYVDYSGTEQKFYPDDRVTILPDVKLGNTWYGTTPEERTLLGRPDADITILPSGVAVAVKSEYGPPASISTTVSQMALPSYEGMDGVYVINTNGD